MLHGTRKGTIPEMVGMHWTCHYDPLAIPHALENPHMFLCIKTSVEMFPRKLFIFLWGFFVAETSEF